MVTGIVADLWWVVVYTALTVVVGSVRVNNKTMSVVSETNLKRLASIRNKFVLII